MDEPAVRRAALAGVVGPSVFLVVSFAMAAVRSDVIARQGWASWPSSMALDGVVGLPEIAAFLVLAACYPVFALGALRPTLDDGMAWVGFLGVAAGDALLAFPTDAPDASLSWHGSLHLAGVILVTVATLVAGLGVTLATRSDPNWRPWRLAGLPAVVLGAAIGIVGGFDVGWAKVAFVLGITLPVPLIGVLVRRDTER